MARKATKTIFATGSKNSDEPGFSLLELMVVIVLMALVLGISYPSLSKGTSILHVRTAGRDILNTFRVARQTAVTEQRSVRLTVDRRERKLTLISMAGKPLRAYTLPSDVKIERMARGGNEVHDDVMTVRFMPNGNLDNTAIRIQADGGGLMLRIVSDPLGGGARIEPVFEEN